MSYTVLVMSQQLSALGQAVAEHFQAECIPILEADGVLRKPLHAVVMDLSAQPQLELAPLQRLMAQGHLSAPVIILTSAYGIQDKLQAFEMGCDDFIDTSASKDEACARITKSIFNKIANEQLSKRLKLATETARSAMVDNSDLGANVQFLLQVHDCDNLDQLGQQFFATIERYGLSCSLQMRSHLGLKNMEAHGMAKELESQLLWQLQNNGRYVDFGRRSIVNYDRTSVLIKNMPVDDPEKYGAVKAAASCLIQGLNTRMQVLEDRANLILNQRALQQMAREMSTAVQACKDSRLVVKRRILTEVDNATEMIHNRLARLALRTGDAAFIEEVIEHLVAETQQVFDDTSGVETFLDDLQCRIANKTPPEVASDDRRVGKSSSGGNVVELF